MAVQFNSDFKFFTTFAAAQNSSGRAIADAVNGKFDMGGAARKIVAASGDKVGAMSRSQLAKNVNNVTRDAFLNAVSEMFGGESKIPESVRKAMKMGDFDGKGHPLTAKRIMLVKTAIDTFNEENPGFRVKADRSGSGIILDDLLDSPAKMKGVKAMSAASYAKDLKPVELTQKKAEKMIGRSLDFMGYTLPKDQRTELADLLKTYGSGMPAKNLRMLSNYIVNKAVTQNEVDRDDIENTADGMKSWSEFKFGDARLNKISAKFIERQNNYVTDTLKKPGQFSSTNPDVFKQVYGDACRADWKINGKTFKMPTTPQEREQRPKEIVDELLSSVKSSNGRKVISTLLNQGNLADLESLMYKSSALIGDANALNLQEEEIYAIPGGDLFVSRQGGGLTSDARVSYGLEVSDDGKTATVTVSIDKHLVTDGMKDDASKIGSATITQKTKIDLTKEMPEVVDVTFAQTFSPDKIWLSEE